MTREYGTDTRGAAVTPIAAMATLGMIGLFALIGALSASRWEMR